MNNPYVWAALAVAVTLCALGAAWRMAHRAERHSRDEYDRLMRRVGTDGAYYYGESDTVYDESGMSAGFGVGPLIKKDGKDGV